MQRCILSAALGSVCGLKKQDLLWEQRSGYQLFFKKVLLQADGCTLELGSVAHERQEEDSNEE